MEQNAKGYGIGSYCDRELILRYMLHLVSKKIEENPEGALKRKGTTVPYTDMKKEIEVWLKVWYE